MTPTIDGILPLERLTFWNVLFAQNQGSDKDLDFDEGLEEDDLQHSKPPSRRPLLWIFLVLLAVGVAYWTLSPSSSPTSDPSSVDMAEATKIQQPPSIPDSLSEPMFQENQVVTLSPLAGDSMLMGDLANTISGPHVTPEDQLTILDGAYQSGSWVYQVQTLSGKTGWIAGEKLKRQS